MMTSIYDDIRRTLETLETVGPEGQADFVAMRIAETHGHLHTPQPGNSWDDQRFNMTLHGVFAEGDSMAELIRNWTRVARCRADDRAQLQDRVNAAAAVIDWPSPLPIEDVRQACQTILDHPRLAPRGLPDRAHALRDALDRAEADHAAGRAAC